MKIKGKARFHGKCQNEAKGCWFWCAITLPRASSCPGWEMCSDPREVTEMGRWCSHVLPSWLTLLWLGCRTELSSLLHGSVNGLSLIITKQWPKEKTPFLSHLSWGLAHYPSLCHLKPQRIMWKIWGHLLTRRRKITCTSIMNLNADVIMSTVSC